MENDKTRTSRASQTRAKAEAPKTWTPPNSLDAPPAPKGYRHLKGTPSESRTRPQ